MIIIGIPKRIPAAIRTPRSKPKYSGATRGLGVGGTRVCAIPAPVSYTPLDVYKRQAQKYVDEGQFAPGSMLPKVQAAMDFASSKEGRSAMITLLEKAKDGIQGKTGTKIHI